MAQSSTSLHFIVARSTISRLSFFFLICNKSAIKWNQFCISSLAFRQWPRCVVTLCLVKRIICSSSAPASVKWTFLRYFHRNLLPFLWFLCAKRRPVLFVSSFRTVVESEISTTNNVIRNLSAKTRELLSALVFKWLSKHLSISRKKENRKKADLSGWHEKVLGSPSFSYLPLFLPFLRRLSALHSQDNKVWEIVFNMQMKGASGEATRPSIPHMTRAKRLLRKILARPFFPPSDNNLFPILLLRSYFILPWLNYDHNLAWLFLEDFIS